MASFIKTSIPFMVVASMSVASAAHAYLGGFESVDGYDVTSLPTMVNSYNAGQYGSANGGPGGSFSSTLPAYDQGGLWDDRNDAYGTYNFSTVNGVPTGYYATRHPAVTGLGMVPHSGTAMLALRNTGYASTSLPATPLDFRYKLDTRDFYNAGNPVNPSATGNKVVDWSIWAAPGPVTNPLTDGVWISLQDSQHNIAGQFGWNENYELRYRDKPSSAWTNTGYVFGRPWSFGGQQVIYDRFDVSLDLLNDTWSLDVFSGVNLNSVALINDLAFGQKLTDFSEIDWHVGYGNEKGFFDDSSFSIREVPEPATALLMLLASLPFWLTRSDRRKPITVSAFLPHH